MPIIINFDTGQPLVFPEADSYEINPQGYLRVFKINANAIDTQYAGIAPGWKSVVVEHPSGQQARSASADTSDDNPSTTGGAP